MLNSSVVNSLKSSENKSLINGDKFLSKTQSFLIAVAMPITSIWQNINEEKDQTTTGDVLHCMQQSIILLGSVFNSLSSFHKHQFKGSLSPEFPQSLINELGSDPNPFMFLFGEELTSKIK